MSVLFETSLGDIIVDLNTTQCPKTSLNFLKLCKTYKYNFCSFHNVVKNFIAQTGDPTDSGAGGSSVFNQLPPTSKDYSPSKYFQPEMYPKLKHVEFGTLSMAVAGQGDSRGSGSQFFFTLAPNLDYLDGKHAPFGTVIEGQDVLHKINEAFVDQEGRPLRDIRIRHVVVLDDPFPDPEGLDVPPNSPVPTAKQLASLRVGDEEEIEEQGDEDERDEARREREARAQALTLEMVGDLPFADVAPPENVLFVCKLNAVTKSEDLELIFSRFGKILSCEIITDPKTGDSLQYAFIEFESKDDAERAYLKMDNVLVDDRRIHVDFSQSVSKLHNSWVFKRTGGRPPPNKGGGNGGGGGRRRHDEEDDDDDRRRDRRSSHGGTSRSDMVFDMAEYDERTRNRPRDRYDDRDRRRDDDRRRGEHRRGGGNDGYRRDDRDKRDYDREDRRRGHDNGSRARSRSPPRRDRDRRY
ncbi:Peptidyl-prolyl cis-trans isomerase-like 4 [Microbotryomycetes sp. NB124-2]